MTKEEKVSAEGEWRVRAHSDLYLPMAMISKDLLDEKSARASLSPLIWAICGLAHALATALSSTSNSTGRGVRHTIS